jgi:phytanoyl-CoA hydroxylase
MNGLQEQFKRDGYLVMRNFLTATELAEILNEAKKVFATQIKQVLGRSVDLLDNDAFDEAMFAFFEKDFERFVHTGKTVQHQIAMHRLGTDERFVRLMHQIGISQPAIGVRPAMQFNSRYLSKGGTHWRLGAHQDWRTGQGSLDSCVIWLPLVPCNTDLGVLQLIPGSHKHGLLHSTGVSYEGYIDEQLPDEAYIEQDLFPGDILIFSALLVHRSGNNTTRNIRWSIQYRFNNLADESYIERGYPHAYIYKPQMEEITPGFPTQEDIAKVYGTEVATQA